MATREQFSSRLGFIMAAAGSAIGLGNIWGFPTQAASHGGAAFLVCYMLLAFALAYPILMVELSLGRYGKAGIFTSLKAISRSSVQRSAALIVAFYAVVVASLIYAFYSIVAGWMLAYTVDAGLHVAGIEQFSLWLTSQSILRNAIFTLLFMGLTLLIIMRGVTDGIERWSTRLMPALLLIMVALIVYVLTLPGAADGIALYLFPDFSQLSPRLLLSAMGQAFFSLSLGVGTMLIYGSYLAKDNNLARLGAAVTLMDTGVAFLAGLLVLPAIFVAKNLGAQVMGEGGELIAGPGLIFSVLPQLFELMGEAGAIVALAFFVLMSLASITSSISMLEVPVSLLVEEGQLSRVKATLLSNAVIASIALFIVCYFDTLFDKVVTFTTTYSQPIIGLLLAVFYGWVWQRSSLLRELSNEHDNVESGREATFLNYLILYTQYIVPLLVLLIIWQS